MLLAKYQVKCVVRASDFLESKSALAFFGYLHRETLHAYGAEMALACPLAGAEDSSGSRRI